MQKANKKINVIGESTSNHINADGNFCLTDADMPKCPEKFSDNGSIAQMIVSDSGYNFVRQINCNVISYTENHAEGHYQVVWVCDDGPCLMKTELDSDFIYDGEIKNGFPNGVGIMKFINGESEDLSLTGGSENIGDGWHYSGAVLYGIPHGEGILSGPDGTEISGAFRNALLTEGMIKQPTGEQDKFQIRKGTFYHGLLCGDSCELETLKLHYCGQFDSDGRFHGKGRCEYANAQIMDGIWDAGNFIRGLVKMVDGSWYIGEWAVWYEAVTRGTVMNSAPHGLGTGYKTDGTVLTGRWDHCELIDGTIYHPDGKVEVKTPQSETHS